MHSHLDTLLKQQEADSLHDVKHPVQSWDTHVNPSEIEVIETVLHEVFWKIAESLAVDTVPTQGMFTPKLTQRVKEVSTDDSIKRQYLQV